jgi:hypothetical protein
MKGYIILIVVVLIIIALIWIPEIQIDSASTGFLEFQKKLTDIKTGFADMLKEVFEVAN